MAGPQGPFPELSLITITNYSIGTGYQAKPHLSKMRLLISLVHAGQHRANKNISCLNGYHNTAAQFEELRVHIYVIKSKGLVKRCSIEITGRYYGGFAKGKVNDVTKSTAES